MRATWLSRSRRDRSGVPSGSRPEAYNPEDVRYLPGDQFAWTSAVIGRIWQRLAGPGLQAGHPHGSARGGGIRDAGGRSGQGRGRNGCAIGFPSPPLQRLLLIATETSLGYDGREVLVMARRIGRILLACLLVGLVANVAFAIPPNINACWIRRSITVGTPNSRTPPLGFGISTRLTGFSL